jgi:RNA polymerase sigma-70 factor (ECF subfamily)
VTTYTKTAVPRVFSSEEMTDADDSRERFVAQVYERAGARLYRYAVMILADRQDAEDVVQHVFAALLTHRVTPDDLEAYLARAVRNASFSLLRRRRTSRAALERIVEPVAPGCTETERAVLEQALRVLPPEQREVVHLHVYEGMTFQEIGRVTGDSVNTVSARYRYALARLRKTLG